MTLFLALAGLAAIVCQMILPKLPFVEVKPFLVVIPILYGAMRMEGASPFYLAIILGLLIDVLSPQKFGTSAFVLCIPVAIAWSQRENFSFDLMSSVLLLSLIGTFVSLMADYALFCWQSGVWYWHFAMWVRLVWGAAIDMVLAIPFFWICDLVLIRWLRILRVSDAQDYAI